MPRTALMVMNHPGGTSTLAWEPVDGRSVGRDIARGRIYYSSLDANSSVDLILDEI
jgi:hypothetical protein